MGLFRRTPARGQETVATAPDLPARWQDHTDRIPPGRVDLAAELEASDDFGVDPGGPGRWRVALFDDVRALVGDDAIAALPERLARLDGVDGVSHDDREFIDVEGAITGEQLRAWVVAELATTGDPHYWDDRMH